MNLQGWERREDREGRKKGGKANCRGRKRKEGVNYISKGKKERGKERKLREKNEEGRQGKRRERVTEKGLRRTRGYSKKEMEGKGRRNRGRREMVNTNQG